MKFKMFLSQTIAVSLILLLLMYCHFYYEQRKKYIEEQDILELENYLDLQSKNNDGEPCAYFYQNGQFKISTCQKTFYFHDYLKSYEDCIAVKHPCLGYYCPPGMECYMFIPDEDCVGCTIEPNCREITQQE